jgi:uncharacterized protein (DUF1330 family)
MTQEGNMPKGYWIGRVDAHNTEGYQPYAANNPAIFQKFGGRFVVRGGRIEALEGGWAPKRVVALEFPSMEQALKWYRSPEYAPLITLRQKASRGRLVLAEGV